MFSGIGALPKPATESHVVSRGNPVAPCRPKAQRKGITRVGSPRSSTFPNYHELIEEPHHHEAAGDSLLGKNLGNIFLRTPCRMSTCFLTSMSLLLLWHSQRSRAKSDLACMVGCCFCHPWCYLRSMRGCSGSPEEHTRTALAYAHSIRHDVF